LVNEGKDRIKGSILGLILTLSAVIILKTINPAIVDVNTSPLSMTDGVYYTNGPEFKSAPTSETNTANIASGYETLTYNCSNGPVLLIWKYPKVNFQGSDENYSGVKVVRKKCGESEPLSDAKSFKWSFEIPGIYYCMGSCTNNLCDGYMSEPTTSSGTISAPFKNNLKSIRIINDIPNDLHYGVVFHDKEDSAVVSNCSQIFYSVDKQREIECFNNPSVSASSTVFFWNDQEYKSSGQGINFYSEPFGWGTGARAGESFLSADTIKDRWTGQASNLSFNYYGITRPTEYKNIYKSFQSRPGSIKVNGNYLLVLWKQSFCQIFFKNIFNLKSTEISNVSGSINKIDVIPIK